MTGVKLSLESESSIRPLSLSEKAGERSTVKDRKALRTLRSLEGKGLLESKAETTDNGTEIAFKPTE